MLYLGILLISQARSEAINPKRSLTTNTEDPHYLNGSSSSHSALPHSSHTSPVVSPAPL